MYLSIEQFRPWFVLCLPVPIFDLTYLLYLHLRQSLQALPFYRLLSTLEYITSIACFLYILISLVVAHKLVFQLNPTQFYLIFNWILIGCSHRYQRIPLPFLHLGIERPQKLSSYIVTDQLRFVNFVSILFWVTGGKTEWRTQHLLCHLYVPR